MKAPNRDILVLLKNSTHNSSLVNQELERIRQLLTSFETLYTVCKAHEVLDLNSFKKKNSVGSICREIRAGCSRPFVFLFNKN